MATLDDLACLFGGDQLTPWQREILALFAGDPAPSRRMMLHTGRRNGRAAADRAMIWAELATTGHVHQFTAFESWCVTMTALGPLWERLAPPAAQLEPAPMAVIDEAWAPLGAAGPPAAADIVAEINAALADWENGPDAYSGPGAGL